MAEEKIAGLSKAEDKEDLGRYKIVKNEIDEIKELISKNVVGLQEKLAQVEKIAKKPKRRKTLPYRPDLEKQDVSRGVLYKFMTKDIFKDIVGLSADRVQKLKTEPGFPEMKRNCYTISHIKWYIKYLRGYMKDKCSRGADASRKLLAAKAEKVELEVKVMKGALIGAEEAQARLAEVLHAVKEAFLNLPGKLAPYLENKNAAFIKTKLDRDLMLTFNKVSDGLKDSFAVEELEDELENDDLDEEDEEDEENEAEDEEAEERLDENMSDEELDEALEDEDDEEKYMDDEDDDDKL